jgi:hypothetical protein
MIACSVSGAEFGSVLVQCILPFPLLTTGAMFDIWILPFDCYCCHVQSPLHAEELFPCHCKYKHTGFADGAHAGPSTSCEPASRRPPTAEFSLLDIGLRVVLRDRLGQCLVGLKREQEIGSLRDLGLVCLTGGLVRRTRHRWSRRSGTRR